MSRISNYFIQSPVETFFWLTLYKAAKKPMPALLTDLVLAESNGKAGLCRAVVLRDEISLAFPLQHHGMKVWSPDHALFSEEGRHKSVFVSGLVDAHCTSYPTQIIPYSLMM